MNYDNQNSTMSIEAEQSVLGGILADQHAFDRVAGLLEAEHFYRHDHRLIYEQIQKLSYANLLVDPITVHERLAAAGKGEMIGLPYLIQLRSTEPSGARVRTHADIVIEKAKRRHLLVLASEMQEAILNGAEEVKSIADTFVGSVENAVRMRTMQDPQRMSAMMTAYVEMIEARDLGHIKPVSTGLQDLNDKLGGGLDDGTLVVVAGRPAMGKTGFGMGLARAVVEGGGAALVLSMEMPAHQLLDRNVAAWGRIPMGVLRSNSEIDTNTKWPALTRVIQSTLNYDLFIDDQTALSMMAIRAKCRKVKRTAGKLNLIVIDQLSFIAGSKLERRHEQVSEYTRALVALAKEMGCPVVLLCQLSRKVEERPNKRPQLSDLAESGSIEQDADTIIFLYRDEVYNMNSADKGTAEIIIGKKRNGSTGMARAAYIGEQTRFADLEKSWHPQPEKIITPPPRGFD